MLEDYIVVTSFKSIDLGAEIVARSKEGYELHGPMLFHNVYMQPMIKHKGSKVASVSSISKSLTKENLIEAKKQLDLQEEVDKLQIVKKGTKEILKGSKDLDPAIGKVLRDNFKELLWKDDEKSPRPEPNQTPYTRKSINDSLPRTGGTRTWK